MRRLLLCLTVVLAMSACASEDRPVAPAAGPRVEIVGQSFTEADVVSELYRALLDQAGFSASVEKVGARDLYLEPLEQGKVQIAADQLSASTEALNHLDGGDDAIPVASPDVDATLRELTRLGSAAGITPLRPTGAELKSGYAVTKAFATRHSLTTLSDLGRMGQPIALAASPDCAERADCADGLENVYGIRLSQVRPLGSGTADTKAALISGQVQLVQVATTDAQLDRDLVLLEDDRHILDAENITPLVNSDWLADHERARAALERLSGVLTTNDLRSLTAEVNSGRRTARQAARAYLDEQGLT